MIFVSLIFKYSLLYTLHNIKQNYFNGIGRCSVTLGHHYRTLGIIDHIFLIISV